MLRNIYMFIGYCWRRYILFLFINIGIIIFVCVILKKIKITLFPFICIVSKITKKYSSNSSSSSYVSDYVNIVEIKSTQYYTRIEYVRKLYDRNTEYKNYVDSTLKRHEKIHVENSSLFRRFWKWNRSRNFHDEWMS